MSAEFKCSFSGVPAILGTDVPSIPANAALEAGRSIR